LRARHGWYTVVSTVCASAARIASRLEIAAAKMPATIQSLEPVRNDLADEDREHAVAVLLEHLERRGRHRVALVVREQSDADERGRARRR
jgi:hypothetical protein